MSGSAAPVGQTRALVASTLSFTVCFSVWTLFAIIGIPIKEKLGLNNAEFGLLAGTPILTGSLIRLLLGIWTDIYGGRIVFTILMLASAVATWFIPMAETYTEFLIGALGLGVAGGSFAVGIAYVSRWYTKEKQGMALGVFGAGNVGAAVTKFLAPTVMKAFDWQTVTQVWAFALALTAVLFWVFASDDPVRQRQQKTGEKPQAAWLHLAPLKNLQVWRFSLYYFFVFGGFVALALWLTKYLTVVYKMDMVTAGLVAAAYSVPGSIFRILGGVLSDKIGARRVMRWTFNISLIACFFLSYPATDYVIHGAQGDIAFTMAMGILPFTALVFILGFAMSLGKAAVYKHIPAYYPENVGSVGGLVGLIGGLGGFVLPIAFGAMNDLTGVWTSCFMLLFAIVAMSAIWMHYSIKSIERKLHPELSGPKFFPELGHHTERHEHHR